MFAPKFSPHLPQFLSKRLDFLQQSGPFRDGGNLYGFGPFQFPITQ